MGARAAGVVWLGVAGLVALLAACGGGGGRGPEGAPLTAPAIVAALQGSGLPVADVVTYTAETDPNKLLGRPHQYTAKVNWTDTRVKDQPQAGEATIEVFTDAADAQARAAYIDSVGKASPLFLQYVYPRPERKAVLRVPKDLTPDQAQAYQAWFATL